MNIKMNIKATAMLHSLKKAVEVTILEKTRDNQYIAEYNGVRCTAIYNPFVGMYYADDIYGVLS